MHSIDADELGRQRGEDRGVKSPADENTDRHIRHHLLFDRPLHQPPRGRDGLGQRRTDNGKRFRIPIPNCFLPAFSESKERSSFDAANAAEHRTRLGNVSELQVLRERDVIEIAADIGMPQDALQL